MQTTNLLSMQHVAAQIAKIALEEELEWAVEEAGYRVKSDYYGEIWQYRTPPEKGITSEEQELEFDSKREALEYVFSKFCLYDHLCDGTINVEAIEHAVLVISVEAFVLLLACEAAGHDRELVLRIAKSLAFTDYVREHGTYWLSQKNMWPDIEIPCGLILESLSLINGEAPCVSELMNLAA